MVIIGSTEQNQNEDIYIVYSYGFYLLYLIFTENIWENFILLAFIDTNDDEEETFDSIEVKTIVDT